MVKTHSINSLKAELARVRKAKRALATEVKQLKSQLTSQQLDPDFSKRGAPVGLPQGLKLFTDVMVPRKVPRELWSGEGGFKQQIEQWKAKRIYNHYKEQGELLALEK